MSAESFREAGFKAIEQRNWQEAIENLSKAISQSKSPAWLLARSQALMETGRLDEAIADADYAYCTAAERGNDKSRKQMIEAQYRRSVCFFRKKEYANADKCAVWSQRLAKGVAVREGKTVALEGLNDQGYYFATAAQALAEGEDNNKKEAAAGDGDQMAKLSAIMGGGDSKTPYAKDWNKAQIWRGQVLRFLEALPEEDPARKVTVDLTPKKPSTLGPAVQPAKIDVVKSEGAKPAAPTPVPAPDYSTFRTQFYQSDTSITVSIFMKFATKEDMAKVDVRFLEGGKFVAAKGVPRQPPVLFIETHDRISVSKSTWRVASMKLELTLVKEVPGKWPDLGTQSSSPPASVDFNADADLAQWADFRSTSAGSTTSEEPSRKVLSDSSHGSEESAPSAKPAAASSSSSVATASKPPTTAAKGPAYPTSSRSGPKDWDSIGKDDDEEDDAKDVDHFFKQLYKGATPEQQRAMMKSYLESNGTSLSTDWNEVKKAKVETSPPDGMEAKKWGA